MSLNALIRQFSQPVPVEELVSLLEASERGNPGAEFYGDCCWLCYMLEVSEDRQTVQVLPEYRTEGQGA